jgi:ankyrin repeat protein
VKFLLNKGLDMNSKGKGHETALSLAAAKNQPEIVRYLKAHGAK